MSNYNLRIVYRVFLLGLQNFIRNSWLTVVAIIVTILAITFVLAGIIFNTTAQNVITGLSQHLKVSIYFETDVMEADILPLRQVFENHERVADVTYITPQQAKDRFLADYRDDVSIKNAIDLVPDSNIFPATLEVSVYDLKHIGVVSELAEAEVYEEIVESVSLGKTDAQNTVKGVVVIQNVLLRISFTLAVIFVVIAFLVIFNTIRMAIFARREEIQIMRLIGAPLHFIQSPFLVEAGLYGICGGIIANLIIYGGLIFFESQILSTPELVNSYQHFTGNFGIIFLMVCGAILGGILVACLSCVVALQRHLKF